MADYNVGNLIATMGTTIRSGSIANLTKFASSLTNIANALNLFTDSSVNRILTLANNINTLGASVKNTKIDASKLTIKPQVISSLDQFSNKLYSLSKTLQGFNNITGTSILQAQSNLKLLATSLRQVSNSFANISTIDNSKIMQIANTVVQFNNIISNANFSPVIVALETLGNVLKPLSKVDLNKLMSSLQNADMAKITQNINTLTESLKPLIEQLNSAQASLTALSSVMSQRGLKQISKITQPVGDITTNKNLESGFSLGFSLMKIRAIYFTMRRVASTFADIVEYGSDFYETMNMWQVAMRDNLDDAEDFVNKGNQAYGVSLNTLMRTQAVFKNILGDLGNITVETSTSLSKSLINMMLDYASLYNISIEKATEKFQSMLTGQIRPIRSVSGTDISERTIFQLYQEMGGTKTMRQLNQTEKRLLRIYAVFQQMGSAGALGDMSKTINEFANQARMLGSGLKDSATWLGVIIKRLLDEEEILIKLNAAVKVLNVYLKSAAVALGYEKPNFIGGLETSANDATEAIEGTTNALNKLASYDKFDVLTAAETEDINIDQKLLDALAGYDSKFDDVNNKANILAKEWMEILGLTDANNDGIADNLEKIKELTNVIEDLGIAIEAIIIYEIGKKLISLTGIIDILTGKVTILGGLTAALGKLGAIGLIYSVLQLITNWDEMSQSERLITTLMAIASAVMVVVSAMSALQVVTSGGLKAVGIVAGLVAVTAGLEIYKSNIKDFFATDFANGGFPDKGTLFRAGEAGAEIVYNTPGGNTGVANTKQIKSAFYQALVEYGKNNKNADSAININIDGEAVFKATRKQAKQNGYDFMRY